MGSGSIGELYDSIVERVLQLSNVVISESVFGFVDGIEDLRPSVSFNLGRVNYTIFEDYGNDGCKVRSAPATKTGKSTSVTCVRSVLVTNVIVETLTFRNSKTGKRILEIEISKSRSSDSGGMGVLDAHFDRREFENHLHSVEHKVSDDYAIEQLLELKQREYENPDIGAFS